MKLSLAQKQILTYLILLGTGGTTVLIGACSKKDGGGSPQVRPTITVTPDEAEIRRREQERLERERQSGSNDRRRRGWSEKSLDKYLHSGRSTGSRGSHLRERDTGSSTLSANLYNFFEAGVFPPEANNLDGRNWGPAGLPRRPAENPSFTLAMLNNQFRYTDSVGDNLIGGLIGLLDAESNESIKTKSLVLAQSIRRVDFHPLSSSLNPNQDITVEIDIMEERTTVPLVFHGRLGGNRSGVLPAATRLSGTEYYFELKVYCLDESAQNCETALLELVQYDYDETQQPRVCQRALIVARRNHVYLTMGEQDYNNHEYYTHPAMKDMTRLLANTAHYHRVQRGSLARHEDSTIRGYRLKTAQLLTWAVAYGPAAFRLEFEHSLLVGQTENMRPRFVASGDLLHSDRSVAHNLPLNLYYKTAKPTYFDGIEKMYLINNDGAGNLGFRVQFTAQNGTAPALQFNITAIPEKLYPLSLPH